MLTLEQKKALIEYLLPGAGKAPFEDLDVFQTQEVEDNLDQFMEEAEQFVDALREKLLAEVGD